MADKLKMRIVNLRNKRLVGHYSLKRDVIPLQAGSGMTIVGIKAQKITFACYTLEGKGRFFEDKN